MLLVPVLILHSWLFVPPAPAALERDNTWAIITEQQTALLDMKEAQWGQSKAVTTGGHYSERLPSVAALQPDCEGGALPDWHFNDRSKPPHYTNSWNNGGRYV